METATSRRPTPRPEQATRAKDYAKGEINEYYRTVRKQPFYRLPGERNREQGCPLDGRDVGRTGADSSTRAVPAVRRGHQADTDFGSHGNLRPARMAGEPGDRNRGTRARVPGAL